MKYIKLFFIAGFLTLFTLCENAESDKNNPEPKKQRTIVTTDGEVDDMDSFIRMLLYSNEFHLEGLVYSSSQWHYKGDGRGTLFTSEMPSTKKRYGERTDLRWPGTGWMEGLVEKYAKVYDNLQKHDSTYPSPDYLKSIIKIGNIDFEGEMEKDTEGSNHIKNIILHDKEGPVYVQAWGGTNTLARALKSIEEEYKGTNDWANIYKKVSEKTIIYTILDQDATYKKYVEPNWPDIRVIYNSAQFWSFAYMWQRVVPEDLKPLLQGAWFSDNILFNHGPLMSAYYTWGDGKQIEGDPEHKQGSLETAERSGMSQYSFISEGDSPAFFFLLNFGLRSTEDPSYGGLGGRFAQSETNPRRWEDGSDVTDLNPETGEEDSSYPQVRWIKILQNDFATRADWCVTDFAEANHAPVVELEHAQNLVAQPGETINIEGSATDPDDDVVGFNWWQYKEAGTFNGLVEIKNPGSQKATVTIPDSAKAGQTIHLVLEVNDKGSPVLTRFERVVVTIGED